MIGVSRPEQLADSLKAVEIKLDDNNDITAEYRKGDSASYQWLIQRHILKTKNLFYLKRLPGLLKRQRYLQRPLGLFAISSNITVGGM